jgi:hypothetical protein
VDVSKAPPEFAQVAKVNFFSTLEEDALEGCVSLQEIKTNVNKRKTKFFIYRYLFVL